jgi:hypothetical protein
VETERLPQRGTACQTARGGIGVWVPHASLLVVALRGHGEAAFAAPIVDAYEQLAKGGPVHLFFDAEDLTNYDSPLRTELTARFFPDRARLASFEVLVRSRLVAMGVSVANLALGGVVKMSADRAHFKARLDACVFENRIVGFSSNVLEGLQRQPAQARR